METRGAMSRTGPGRLLIALALLAPGTVAAQQTSVDLEPVDQAIEDVSVLSMSLRQVEPGLGQPNDFSRVYRVRGRPDRFMRVQGGLYAVFPESVYGTNKEGQLQAVVPNDTVFYIGRPSLLNLEPPRAAPYPGGLIQARIDLRIDPNQESAAPAASLPGRLETPSSGQSIPRIALPAIVSDEAYRQRRVRGLMRRAADHAARGRSSSSK
jgi:hypothetical protein